MNGKATLHGLGNVMASPLIKKLGKENVSAKLVTPILAPLVLHNSITRVATISSSEDIYQVK